MDVQCNPKDELQQTPPCAGYSTRSEKIIDGSMHKKLLTIIVVGNLTVVLAFLFNLVQLGSIAQKVAAFLVAIVALNAGIYLTSWLGPARQQGQRNRLKRSAVLAVVVGFFWIGLGTIKYVLTEPRTLTDLGFAVGNVFFGSCFVILGWRDQRKTRPNNGQSGG